MRAPGLPSTYRIPSSIGLPCRQRRCFHDYFITHIPSTSLHPDSRSQPALHHRLPRDKSTPYNAEKSSRSPAAVIGSSREMTVVRIPLKSAKRRPVSLSRSGKSEEDGEVTPEVGATGDPQVFYFGVFDGHGGSECSGFLREQLHDYLEKATAQFELKSSLLQERNETQAGSPKAKGEASSGDQRKRGYG